MKISDIYSNLRDLNENYPSSGRWDYQNYIPSPPQSGDPGYYVPKKLYTLDSDGNLKTPDPNPGVSLATYIAAQAAAEAKAKTGKTSGSDYDTAYSAAVTAIIKDVRQKLGLPTGTSVPSFSNCTTTEQKQVYISFLNTEVKRENQAMAKGWLDSGVFGDLNSLQNNLGSLADNNKSYLKTANACPNPKWVQFTYEEILQMETNGTNIPKDVLDWAHSCDNADTTTYEIANADGSNSDGSEDSNIAPQDDSVDNLRKKAVENTKACEEKDDAINKALEEFNPRVKELTDIKDEVERTQQKSMSRIQSMVREWDRLDKKSKDGQELTETEQQRFQELSQMFEGENAIDKDQMDKYAEDLKNLSKDMVNIENLGKSNVEFGDETNLIGKNLAEKTSKYKSKYANVAATVASNFGPMAWMFQKDVRLGLTAVKEGTEASKLGDDVQVEMNKTASTLDIEGELANSKDTEQENETNPQEAASQDENQKSGSKINNEIEDAANNTISTSAKNSTAASGGSSSPTVSTSSTAPSATVAPSPATASNSDADTAGIANNLDRAVKSVNSNSDGQQTGSVNNPAKDDAVNKTKKSTNDAKQAEQDKKSLDKQSRDGEKDAQSGDKTTGDVKGKTGEADKIGKKAKNNAKEMKTTDKQIKDAEKEAKAALARTEAEIAKVTVDTEKALADLEEIVTESEAIKAEQQSQQSNSPGGGMPGNAPASPSNGNSTSSGGTTNSFSTGGGASAPGGAPPSGGGSSDETAARAAALQNRTQATTDKINTNTGRIKVLQNTAQQRSVKVMNTIKAKQKQAQKIQKDTEKDQKITDKINKVLTVADYVFTGVKLVGKVVSTYGTAATTGGTTLTTTGTTLISTGTAMIAAAPAALLGGPAMAAAGAALVVTGTTETTAGTTLTATGTVAKTVGSVMKTVGTIGGLVCKVGKAVIAGVNGDILGCVMNTVGAVLTCAEALGSAASAANSAGEAAKTAGDTAAGATEAASGATDAVSGATEAASGATDAVSGTVDAVSNVGTSAAVDVATEAGKEVAKEASKQIVKEVSKEALKEGLKTIVSKDTLMDLGGMALSASSGAFSKKPEQQQAAAGQSFGNYTMSQQSKNIIKKDKKFRGAISGASGANHSGGQNSGGSHRGRR